MDHLVSAVTSVCDYVIGTDVECSFLVCAICKMCCTVSKFFT